MVFSEIGNKSVPIQLAQFRFPGLAISNAKDINVYFQIKYTEAILSNSTRKLLWIEITKMMFVIKKIIVSLIIFGTLSFPIPVYYLSPTPN